MQRDMIEVPIILLIILIGLIGYFAYHASVASFKVGYYEQKLKNRRDWFTDEQWEKIQRVMDK
jgi:hypothetical protein